MDNSENSNSIDAIAIIGMAGRFPGAKNVDEFWRNIRDGIESISFFSEEELKSLGIDESVLRDPRYVKAKAVLDDIELFDAAFFGFNPREAEITDPQHRFFLESAWEALENAGYNPETYAGPIGVYGGAGSFNTYFLNNLYPNRTLRESLGDFQLVIANDKDFLSTRVSYKLNLKGPSVTVQTACSTSLVAISMACQSLLNYQCDMALAGGVAIGAIQKTGYFYKEGMILSPDGHCRAFDAKAQGTVSGNGVGIVVLKRLEDAIADRDYIHAVIKGWTINNDGSLKVGYTAPSVEGQAQAIADALALADVEPETVSYIEAHGTGTPLGDPIEIAALTQAFSQETNKKCFCAIGSAKTNIGHLDTAAGVTGLIKTVQALKHKLIPPSLHFEQPNPKIDFANSPFYVNTKLTEWKAGKTPRRAGVSSFGIGGTNAHVVLEEAPNLERESRGAGEQAREYQLLVLSAKNSATLDNATANLAKFLNQHPDVNLGDVAYTLEVGRKAFSHRRIVVCNDIEESVTALNNLDPKRVFTTFQESKARPVVFMFSGQGSQYVNMGLELYQVEPTFREQIDLCSDILQPHLGIDLRHVLYPNEAQAEAATNQLKQTAITQPALFAIEYALAKLWMSWGVNPVSAIGHSIGEYVAACLAGVFSLEDALSLVAARGKLMQQMPGGSMLAVPLPEQEIQPLLGDKLDLALINGTSAIVVSGTNDAIDELQQKLLEKGIDCRRLHTSHAFHSRMMEPILEPFIELVKKIKLNSPKIPYISNVTGTWITATEATNPSYYAQHLRQTVRFAEGLQKLCKEPNQILLEVGPGRTLNTLAKQHPDKVSEQVTLSSLRHPQDQQSDENFLLTTLGKLWLAGVQIDWSNFYADEQHYRIPLPTYPFDRQRYWIEPPGVEQPIKTASPNIANEQSIDSNSLHLRPNLGNIYIAPRDEVEQTIAQIWQEFLGIQQVGIHDDFFDLGGDSLLAVQLITKISETLQKTLSPHSLLQAPTVAALAELTKENSSLSEDYKQLQSTSESLLVEIQRGSFKHPLFLVHPVGGHVYIYRDLARYLGSNWPVVGIQAPASVEENTVEEMATRYIEALRIRQPEGPYFMGGSSFGGTVAFEMAQQLNALGEKVALLTLIDTPGPGQMPVLSMEDDTAILVYILGVGFNLSLSLDVLQKLNADEQLLYFLEQVKIANRVVPPDFGLPEIRQFIHLFKVHAQAMKNYIPRTYPGQIIFFRATEQNEVNPKNPELPWLEVASGGVEVRDVPGNHITMNYPPNVQFMAEQLRGYLDEARQII
ncbi:type I polyketide synthase [Argonema antarcticum]|uniref:type I polyketide synthase n=1 Tax=Argonema antarcticum TaxID=2942763 RepID=UPI0020113139|nr:type I polyketide synthase [Argonema antarcticum]MCL1472482.1 acyltransferase domain-containing protein [Argonema antarcticum A004/B2]